MDLDFGELAQDEKFKELATNLKESIDKLQDHMERLHKINYDKLSQEDKVKYDIYQTYAINSIFWMYLKLIGEDLTEHGVIHELSRVKEAMARQKQFQDRKLQPRLEKDVAKRFVKHGLQIPREEAEKIEPNRKKRKLE